jgi:hypothetical protein
LFLPLFDKLLDLGNLRPFSARSARATALVVAIATAARPVIAGIAAAAPRAATVSCH